VACSRPAPALPSGFDLPVEALIQSTAAALHRHLRLHPDAMANNIGGNAPQGLARVGVVSDKLPAAIAQAHKAAADFSVC
jgi:hypothetical protein